MRNVSGMPWSSASCIGPDNLQSTPISSVGASAVPAMCALRITSVPGCCAASAPHPASAHASASAANARTEWLSGLLDDRIIETVHASRAGQVLAAVAGGAPERDRHIDATCVAAMRLGKIRAKGCQHGLVLGGEHRARRID